MLHKGSHKDTYTMSINPIDPAPTPRSISIFNGLLIVFQ